MRHANRLPKSRALRAASPRPTPWARYGLERRAASLWPVRRTARRRRAAAVLRRRARASLGDEAQIRGCPRHGAESEHVVVDYQHDAALAEGASARPFCASGSRLPRRKKLRSDVGDRGVARRRERSPAAGVVLVRQRPGEGKAIFVTLEDETGVTNILLWARDFEKYRRAVMASRLMEVHGIVQKSPEGVVHLMGAHVYDRTAELGRLSSDHEVRQPLSRADEFAHPQHPRSKVPRGRHPRDVRILPASRDFH